MIYILIVLLAPALHEAGHWVAARAFGYVVRFRFEWGRVWKIPVTRFTWAMPTVTRWRQKVIAGAGFGAELGAAPFFYALSPLCGLVYFLAAWAHFVAYPWYAGDSNDFVYLID